MALDRKNGNGFYTDHLWAIGLNFLLSGIITGIICCIVDPPNSAESMSGNYTSLLNLDEGIGGKMQEAGSSVKETVEHFIREPSEADMFCYIPLNYCSLSLSALGAGLIAVDWILPK